MFGNLFIKTKNAQSLEAFARQIFVLLNVQPKETRYSENAPSGRYLYGEALGLRVVLTEADDSDFPDYDFLLCFRAQNDWATIDRHSLDGLADIVAKHLARHGMKIARRLEFSKAGSERVEYGDTDF